MSTALIIYGSTTGNTESVADTISTDLSKANYIVKKINVSDVDVDILNEAFDLYLLGSSTWGDDDIEFQEDFAPFYENMNGDLNLSGKRFAVFGCGDSSYEYFCGAVDAIEERLEKLGATLVCESLKIDGEPEESEINEWTQDVINAA
ncbi:flavodoxin [Desulfobacter vibrioformis]|uniref:flavodoxin n=1 Tax=Desulfobacter vibrioformis TaxID=34031 RepID=UPI00055178D5|nr:flavodoxin [Desulfobacter vibrioformis]